MFNTNETEQNDPLKEYYQEIADGMEPPPALVKGVKSGMYLSLAKNVIHVRKFAKAMVSYAMGIVLLLGIIILLPKIWGSREPVVSQTTDPAGTITPAFDIPLSSLYEGETVTEIQLWNEFYSHTDYTVVDGTSISTILSELDATNSANSSHYFLIPQSFRLILTFEDGSRGALGFAQGSNAVNYTTYDAQRQQQSLKKLWISNTDRERLELLVNTQIQMLISEEGIPAPEEYLGGEITVGRLWYRTPDSHMGAYLSDQEVEIIAAKMQTVLKDLTLTERPLESGEYFYKVQLHWDDKEEVHIFICPETGLIRVTMGGEEIHHAYNFGVPIETAKEYAEWLSEYYPL